MMYTKLRFNRNCTINIGGVEIEGRIVYGDFPCGYGRDSLLLPKIVVDREGTAYRPFGIAAERWGVVNDIYLKRTGLTRKQIGGCHGLFVGR
jgi:hypothetical protein